MSQRPGPGPVLAALPDVLADCVGFYLDVHRSPELSGAEERTAGLFAGRLRAAGYRVTTGIGGHGVAGVLRNGPGPVVLLRAELDALPVREATGAAYASTVRAPQDAAADGSCGAAGGGVVPVSHACGHDMHLACLAGAAALLARGAAHWRGTAVVVGQPAEETLTGAEAMLRDGLYERLPAPSVVLAQHTAPLPAGMVAHGGGLMLSAGAMVTVTAHGTGGHAATAHLGVNPVEVAAAITLRARESVAAAFGAGDHVSVTVGALHAGTRGNVVPDRARLEIAVRAPDAARRDRAVEVLRGVCAREGAAYGCPRDPQVEVRALSPATVCDAPTLAALRTAHLAAFGAGRVAGWPPSSATEDFALFGSAGAWLHGVPGIRTGYWMLGSVGPLPWRTAPGGTAAEKLAALPGNHSPAFLPDPRLTTPAGITAMTTGALAMLGTARGEGASAGG
ncbi:amidohydrolase [Streptomyces sp. SL13]|uniref:Amidohydrolase n=1 Tax=Streptantibioticus silvisoli TaxID=2705255 RepID=A0AA90H8D0_9ACTN|nr:amidohydrolase [Streptantibioticus silvisoli]MDI5972379.1 amidohydrolase [Streptantibioticus silvisoli]